jgi:hypothetical protein
MWTFVICAGFFVAMMAMGWFGMQQHLADENHPQGGLDGEEVR